MDGKLKKFHFQELDWIVTFPELINEGKKYLYYSVSIEDRKSGNLRIQVCLGDVLDNPEFEKNVPHTVGFFKEIKDNGNSMKFAYLEIRMIRSIEEFWKFLNDTNL